ncbi:MAG: cytochrome c oxidase subunit 3 [Acidobacteriota bacterium]
MSKVLPFSLEPNIDENELGNARLGMWLFLISELVLFAALFVLYLQIRGHADEWPRGADYLDIPAGVLSSAMLIVSSITMMLAWNAARERKRRRFQTTLGLTILLGTAYMVIKIWEYQVKLAAGLMPSTNFFLGLYYTTTGVHVFHALCGVLYNAYLWGPGSRLWDKRPVRFANQVELAGLFWHFVDIVWLFLFPMLYLL